MRDLDAQSCLSTVTAGNIVVGEGATVAAAALVNKPVPPGHTAIGAPAKNIPPKRNINPILAK